jgi:hypothetical protein
MARRPPLRTARFRGGGRGERRQGRRSPGHVGMSRRQGERWASWTAAAVTPLMEARTQGRFMESIHDSPIAYWDHDRGHHRDTEAQSACSVPLCLGGENLTEALVSACRSRMAQVNGRVDPCASRFRRRAGYGAARSLMVTSAGAVVERGVSAGDSQVNAMMVRSRWR